MKIHTLVDDIYATIRKKKNGWFTDELATDLGQRISRVLQTQLGDERPASRLRMSSLGPRCPKALWLSIHKPESAEPLPPWAEIKYSFGHVLEALTITLAKSSGHSVTGEGDELRLDGIVGHRDCVVDGCVVDVKSCSSRAFAKFKNGSIKHSDDFGYLEQLDAYVTSSLSDDLVSCKDRGYLLAIDKQLGHMVIYEHIVRKEHILERIRDYKEIIARPSPPPCLCGSKDYGASGNLALDLRASYSPYKWECFPHLRCFLYKEKDGVKPVFLSKVVRKPDVQEVDRHGRTVY